MQGITLNSVKSRIFNDSSINQCLINGTRNSFQNSKCISGLKSMRNLTLISGLSSNKNTDLTSNLTCQGITTINSLNTSLYNQQKLWKCQSVRYFSKTGYFLDSNSNKVGQDKVKIDTEKFLIGFTCKKCNNRSYKLISKKSYYEGVVIIRCDKCKNLHLIADHLGWYDSMNKFGTIEDYFKRQQNNPSGNKTVIRKDLKQLTQTEQNDVIEFLKEEQKEQEEKQK